MGNAIECNSLLAALSHNELSRLWQEGHLIENDGHEDEAAVCTSDHLR